MTQRESLRFSGYWGGEQEAGGGEGEKMIFFFPLLVLGLFLPMVSDFASSLGHLI